MRENKSNLLDIFGLGTITKVTSEMKPLLFRSKSKSIVAIYLGQLYRQFNDNEKMCMLNILHVIYNGSYRNIIDLMNIKNEDKLNYLDITKARG